MRAGQKGAGHNAAQLLLKYSHVYSECVNVGISFSYFCRDLWSFLKWTLKREKLKKSAVSTRLVKSSDIKAEFSAEYQPEFSRSTACCLCC